MIIKIIFLILIWVLPIVMLTRTYVKMSKKEQEEFKGELRNPYALLIVGLLTIGLLLYFSGFILLVKPLQHIGVSFVFIYWLANCINGWKNGKLHGATSGFLIFLGVIGITAYGYVNI
ncbi:Fe3+-siderophore ABC transporter permease [Ornithinibacillus halotolerans]|nr:Fe3+-siderophore ABC transporter permease [Ornithinibacillus halotolerans]